MLKYLYLAVLVTASTSNVLKVEDKGEYTDNAQDEVQESLYGQPEVQFSSIDKAGGNGYDRDNTLRHNPTFGSGKCSINKKFNYADCSRRNITDIGQIDVPPTIIGLDLAHNYLQTIPDNAFSMFTQLNWLNISYNKLQGLNNGSFYNLNVLEILRIHNNNLTLREETFPANVFKPLINLQHLWMNSNVHVKHHKNLSYPDTALSWLHTVIDLRIDGLPNKTFGKGFGNMSSLVNLTLKGNADKSYCHLASLAKNMFTYLGGLTNLSLINCNISGKGLDPDVFVPLKKLIYLDLSGNDDLKLGNLSIALEKIRSHSKLKVLKIANIINPYSPGVFVPTSFAKSLPAEIEELDASCNALQVLEDGVFDSLPKSLRVLYVGANKFAFLDYLKDFGKLTNLKVLILSREYFFILPYYYPPNPNLPVSFHGGQYGEYQYIHQPLPPNLEKLNIMNAGWSNYLTEFHFNETNTLQTLNLDFNNFPVLRGPITGLNYLKNLSLFSCRIREIHSLFFQNFTSLRHLNLSSNYFGRVSFRTNETIFSDLINLQVLDLSFTDIRFISYDTFKGLNSLEYLLLELNPITEFKFDISHMTNIIFINVSMTDLVTIPPVMTKMLDNTHNKSFQVDFSKNTFDCFCSNREFLKWALTTSVVKSSAEFTCSFGDGTKIDLNLPDLMEIYGKLRGDCASNFKLFSVVISVTIFFLFVIIGAILFTFRWKLRYLYYSAILHYKSSNRTGIEDSFEYDVFVSYAHEDNDFVVDTLYPQLQASGLKIHIHGLHFTAGDFISSNILNAIHSSKRTLVVLTQNHVSSKWCQYEVEMANMEQVYTGRSVLLFLIPENIQKLTTKLIYHIKNNTYITYPAVESSPNETRAFWTKLAHDLKS